MKTSFRVLNLILFLSLTLTYSQNKEIHFYISNSGNDSWLGKLSEPNKTKTDGPFASLEKAKEAVIEIIKSEKGLRSPIKIFIREGIYSLSSVFKLGPEISGTKDFPIEWKSYKNEKVIITGSRPISGLKPLKDPLILERIPKENRNKIFEIDLKNQGITNYGKITLRGGAGMELFYNDKRMTLCRYPNEGWLKIADVPQSGEKLINEGLEREKRFDSVPVGRHYGRIKYDGNKPGKWSSDNEIYMHGYWTWDWSDAYQKVKSINADKKEITIEEPHNGYGYTKNQRYYFFNVLEELDLPGEWYFDRKNGKAYIYLPEPVSKNEISISMLDTTLFLLDNCEYLTIQGIQFEKSRSNGIVIKGGSNNLVAGCTFRQLGNNAVIIDEGNHNGIKSCNIFDVNFGGIVLKGGDRKTLAPGNNFAENNHIFDYSKFVRTSQHAIHIMGVGNRTANNLIHDAPHQGIYVTGNDHVIEYNEIHNVCNETGDAGALYSGRDYTWQGNIIRYNYFHHLKGPGLHGVIGIYLDDFSSGFTVYGNICYKTGRGTLIGGGRDNTIENNIYVDCHPSIVLDARGLSWASYYFNGKYPTLFENLNKMNYSNPPYSKKYPKLPNYPNDTAAIPKNNKILKNISYGGRWIELYDYFSYDFSVISMKNNLISDNEICKRIKQPPNGWEPYYLNLDTEDQYAIYKFGDKQIMEEFKENLFINKDPGFIDFSKGNFKLKKNSPALKIGFKQIPVEKIGLFIDEYRKSLPK